MFTYPIPPKEQERQEELESYKVLDTLAEEEYDNITNLASFICETPISLITLIDNKRQWFKSHPNVDVQETPRDIAFCAHTILQPEVIMEIADLRKDDRFKNFPFVTGEPNLVFYAGAPLVTTNGNAIGTICVLDTKPRVLSEKQKIALQALSKQVMNLLELRKITYMNQVVSDRLKRQNVLLEQFAKVAAHDLKSPLNSMTTTVDLLTSVFSHEVSSEAQESLQDLKYSALHLSDLIDGILQYSRNETLLTEQKKDIHLQTLLQRITSVFINSQEVSAEFINCDHTITANAAALTQIFTNLISNAVKYCTQDCCTVTITFAALDNHYEFTVRDNGPGIKQADQAKIFDMFVKLQFADKFGAPSTGIGLHTVQNLVERLGGTIRVSSEIGKGATFTFTIAR